MIRVIKERGKIRGRMIQLYRDPKLHTDDQIEVLICISDGFERDDEDCIEAVLEPKSGDASHSSIIRTLFGFFNRFSLTPVYAPRTDPLGNEIRE